MESLLSAEGSLTLAISALAIVLGYRFTLPERGRDFAGILVYVAAIAVTLAAAYGFVPRAGAVDPGLAGRIPGGLLLVAGFLLAGASFRARLEAGRGRLATGGPYARIRHPLYLGLGMVLAGHLLRLPSSAGLLSTALALASYGFAAAAEEREAAARFGAEWEAYARRTGAVVPRRAG
ncbi:conserved hypothetical protein [Anaeromyxobacter dehalogenans 2CP-1]|uniref:Isoprenylcysteine carboxyl methyltransferase n=1 Tax=Anaeromyxobacter dehalogenans (strain ATCC BAA-258 / DSM 21875 / 2CP-1) TaxID=455488 RepID=B8JAS2_ANAD2|nr:methyltransferase [Anaeromyxobacter dehalogenans]ACL67571.1 conserved hypothetical protein [Anaeromyxobacter dehalogenans 2CP-1]